MIPPILHQYTILVNFLGKALGPDYEIVLHDITAEPSRIIAIANGHISGRAIGSPTTNSALQTLAANPYKTNDFLYNYQISAKDGRILRASTMFIRMMTEILSDFWELILTMPAIGSFVQKCSLSSTLTNF